MMGLFAPIFFVGRAVNTAATAYVVSKVGWKAFVTIRKMQKEKEHADKIRVKFIENYTERQGEEPNEETIKAALDTFNAVEFPVRKRIDDAIDAAKDSLVALSDGEWLKKVLEKNKPKQKIKEDAEDE